METNNKSKIQRFFINLISGAVAGTAVDIALFPLDTIKTRMQSARGFAASGGFRGVYSGLAAAAGGSAPSAALFFCAYEYSKDKLHEHVPKNSIYSPLVHMTSGGVGEIAACLVRVPTDNVKQKMQANMYPSTSATITAILKTRGIKGFYVGYHITILREIPFAFVQFPIYEKCKQILSTYRNGQPASPLQSSLCGSFAGGIAAAVTTPMDVIKTRLMLGHDASGASYGGPYDVLKKVVLKEGWRTLFSGIGPRVTWISIGGSVFFGAYETSRKVLTDRWVDRK